MRGNYWSCSKFADWVRGTAKPPFLELHEWGEWEESAKEEYPFRYWLVEEFLDNLQDVVYWPADMMNKISYYISNRWITRSHALTADPKNIRPGQWFDLSERILYCVFDELVNFRLSGKLSNWYKHEWKAMFEWMSTQSRQLEPVARSCMDQVAFRVIK